MKIQDILRRKGGDVVVVEPDKPVLTAVRILSEHRIGALVVQSGDEIVGIISERDLLNLVARAPADVESSRVEDIMTRDLIVGVPDDDLDYVMNIMTENRIRHLPIVEEDRLGGIVSIGDVVNAVRKSVEAENRHLRDYIRGARA